MNLMRTSTSFARMNGKIIPVINMFKVVFISFVAAIVATLAGYCLCQSEVFKLHYCALVFVTTFGAMICTVAFWSDLKSTLEGYSKDSKRSIIGDNIAFTILSWILPISIFVIGLLR